MKTLYFTATGNGLCIAKRLGGEAIPIPRLIKSDECHIADDKVGLVFPIYFLSVPKYVEEFLGKVRIECDYLFAVLSCGNFPGAAVNHLERLTAARGLKLVYANTLTMVDNWLPMFDMDEQLLGEPKKEIDARLDSIATDVAQGRQWINRASLIGKAATRFLARQYPGNGMCLSYTVEENCNGCGICAQVCPVDNITLSDGRPQFADRGISCLACTHNCPQNAIRAKGEKSKTRFRNRNVSLSEIVQSNK
ncbi:MAG: EFR1 family ferrodoxin [Gracilibacteraceae bacterium]|jgi:ferredoxin|nr:EFR1 family ferrodoxin [Gracilibacteraceae bacterium]